MSESLREQLHRELTEARIKGKLYSESSIQELIDLILRLVVKAVEGMPLVDVEAISGQVKYALHIAAEAERAAIVRLLKPT